MVPSFLTECVCATCPVVQAEVGALVSDAADVPDGGDAGVFSVILRTKILQLQDLRLPLQSHTHTCFFQTPFGHVTDVSWHKML